MTTSLRDLLAAAGVRAEGSGASEREAEAAITALGHLHRALVQLATNGVENLLETDSQQQLVMALAHEARTAAAGWTATVGDLPDLVGVAADVASLVSRELTPASRWAVAVAFAETTRRCIDAACRFEPYEHLSQLRQPRSAAVEVERHAASDPPPVHGTAILDRLIPRARPSTDLPGAPAFAEAAAGLLAATSAAVERHELTVAEALAATSAARFASTQCVGFADVLLRRSALDRPWAATPAAWRAVQYSYAAFDDGTKLNPPPSSTVIAWAARLHDALKHDFDTRADLPRATGSVGAHRMAETATGLRTVANQLPALADALARGVENWALTNAVLAPERRLFSYERRNLAVTTKQRIVVPHRDDLVNVVSSLRDAQRISISLVAELDRTSNVLGSQPQPNVIAAHRESVRADPAEALIRSARAAERRAGAERPTVWAIQRTAPRIRPPDGSRRQSPPRSR